MLYPDLGSSVVTWNLKCNIQIGGPTKKSDKKKIKRSQLQGEIGEIRVKFFTRKKHEMCFH